MDAAMQQAALEQARSGDRGAQGELLESLRPYVRLLVRAVRNGRAAARLDDSDLIQDALLEAHRSFGAFRGETVEELLAWLRPIVLRAAGHTLRGHLATAKRNVARERAAEKLAHDAVDSGSSPSAQAIRHERTARVAEALARLPDDMQEVLLARHVDGLSHAAIAERMHRTEGAVRVLYTRALRRLRDECPE